MSAKYYLNNWFSFRIVITKVTGVNFFETLCTKVTSVCIALGNANGVMSFRRNRSSLVQICGNISASDDAVDKKAEPPQR